MVVRGRERRIGSLVHDSRRRDVEQCNAFDGVRVVETKAVRHARTAVVSHETKVREALRAHQFDLVGRHGALRIVDAALTSGGLRGIAVSA